MTIIACLLRSTDVTGWSITGGDELLQLKMPSSASASSSDRLSRSMALHRLHCPATEGVDAQGNAPPEGYASTQSP